MISMLALNASTGTLKVEYGNLDKADTLSRVP